MIETLRYADEIQKADALLRRRAGGEAGQGTRCSLAEELIERKAKPFDPKAFKDPYEAALRELIDAKIEKRAAARTSRRERPSAKVIDLMEALKRSVGGRAAPRRSRPPARPAPAEKTRTAAKRSGARRTPAARKARQIGAEPWPRPTASPSTGRKRDFAKTAEPSGKVARRGGTASSSRSTTPPASTTISGSSSTAC